MQLQSLTTRPRCAAARRALPVRTHAESSRRGIAIALLAAPLVLTGAAQARNAAEAKAEAEERKRRLREAAAETERTGRDQTVFEDSAYSLPEDSRTPNIHSRQGEGAKTQINA